MKIYTKSGDDGRTGLYAGPRLPKDDARIEAYGTLDELNAAIGLVRSHLPPVEIDDVLKDAQDQLFAMGAELATLAPSEHGTQWADPEHVAGIERAIDKFEDSLPPLQTFILPAGTPVAAALHLARAICRRAERRVVTLAQQTPIAPELMIFLNRLGDLLFVLSRAANAAADEADVPWQKPTGGPANVPS